MTVDRERIDALLATIDPAMIVVTVEADGSAGDGERSGCLVGFHSQCSIDPLRYAVWISRANHTFGVAGRARRFTLHLLGNSDRELAAVFGSTTGDEVDKWKLLDLADLSLDTPRIDCELVDVLDDGSCDHVCFVLEPTAVVDTRADGSTDVAPLRFSGVRDLQPGHDA